MSKDDLREYSFFPREDLEADRSLLHSRFGTREGQSIWQRLTEAIMDHPGSDRALVWRDWMGRILEGEPVQYVTGRTWFYGMNILVNRNVLIPRPETEELVLWANQWCRSKSFQHGTAIDWGTGSGCIALAFKKHHPDWTVVGRDVSSEALQTAGLNSRALQLDILWEERDMSSAIPHSDRRQATLILANPPYIPTGERDLMSDQVLRFEPPLALFSPKPDPLYYYQKLMVRAEEELLDKGVMIMELNEFRANATALLFSEAGWATLLAQDLEGKNRMLMVARRSSDLVSYQLI